MFNVIGSQALYDRCERIGLYLLWLSGGTPAGDVYIVDAGSLDGLHGGASVRAFKLSELLLEAVS